MKKSELVFIPCPGIDHLSTTIEFAKFLLQRHDRFSVTVLLIKPAVEIITKFVSVSCRLSFIDLPQVEPPPLDLFFKSGEKYISDSMEFQRACVKDAIVKGVLLGIVNLERASKVTSFKLVIM